jgi:hypothetical protein
VAEPEYCHGCFPGGLPEGAASAGCEHGTWYAAPLAVGGPVTAGAPVVLGPDWPEAFIPAATE